jgi:hypothetical protein
MTMNVFRQSRLARPYLLCAYYENLGKYTEHLKQEHLSA